MPHRSRMSLGYETLATIALTRKLKMQAYQPHMQLAAPPSRLLFAHYALPRAVCARLTGPVQETQTPDPRLRSCSSVFLCCLLLLFPCCLTI